MSQITYQDVAGFSAFFQHKCFETYAKNPDGFEDGVLARRVRPDIFLQNVLSVLNYAELKRPANVRPAVKEGLLDILTFLQDPRNKLLKLKIGFTENPFLASVGSTDLAAKVDLISVPKHTRLAFAKKVDEVVPQEAAQEEMTIEQARSTLASAFPIEIVSKFDHSFRDSHAKLLGHKPFALLRIVLDAIYPYLANVLKEQDSYEQIHRKLSLIWHEDRVSDPAQKEILGLYFRSFEYMLSKMDDKNKGENITKASFASIANRRLKYKAVDLNEALSFFERAKNFALQTRRFELVGLHAGNIDEYISQNILTEDQFYAFFGLLQPAPRQPDITSKEVLDSFNHLIETAESIEDLRKSSLYNYAYRKAWDNALFQFIASPEMRSKVTFVTFLYCAKAIETALQAEKSIQPKKFQLKIDVWAVAEALNQKFNEYSKKSHKENKFEFSVADREPLPIKKPPTMPPRPTAKKTPA